MVKETEMHRTLLHFLFLQDKNSLLVYPGLSLLSWIGTNLTCHLNCKCLHLCLWWPSREAAVLHFSQTEHSVPTEWISSRLVDQLITVSEFVHPTVWGNQAQRVLFSSCLSCWVQSISFYVCSYCLSATTGCLLWLSKLTCFRTCSQKHLVNNKFTWANPCIQNRGVSSRSVCTVWLQ